MTSRNHDPQTNIALPVLGKISAGEPLFSESHPIGEIQWKTESPVRLSSKFFALQVTGDSMIEDGIFDGNHIVVKYGAEFSNGDIVIAYVNDEPTVKRIYRRGDQVILQPANSAYDPIEISLRHTPFRVGGLVVDVIRN